MNFHPPSDQRGGKVTTQAVKARWLHNEVNTGLLSCVHHIILVGKMRFTILQVTEPLIMLGPDYNKFGYNEHPTTKSRFLRIKIIDCNAKRFGYNEQPLITSSLF